MKSEKIRKPLKPLDFYVMLDAIGLVTFTVVCLYAAWHEIEIPGELISSVYLAGGGELGFTGMIKCAKRKWKDE